jgi:hypothetical protein
MVTRGGADPVGSFPACLLMLRSLATPVFETFQLKRFTYYNTSFQPVKARRQAS